ncbi:MAG: aminotransferase class III-fold pyridoxal phosphate-dependent enzyme [Scytonematopsis contorta HA4267-MV1]|jgi:acyl transferase domain-containing protein|nr:aminotransferase class III-fold pyridoxal phosphate-dependent enzyme [Scytonematopsis contorta HA4267-MV1]
MNNTSEFLKIDQLSSSQRLLFTLDESIKKIQELEYSKIEPIAIIGTGYRFPGGATNTETFWQILADGVDTITEIPSERWNVDEYYDPDPDAPGKMYTPYGGFLQQVDQFDPQFFGISPREAARIDPQQRLLLEVSWEALENAGYIPNQEASNQTGVFIGITTNDYARLLMPNGDFSQIDAFYLTGNPLNAVAGRLSYVLGLTGPCMAIDTACSSSLVAIHLACQSLRNKECNLALAGGVNLILSPENTIALSKARIMSSSGRCKTFDASADGIVRGEGCGVLVLKRLTQALADGDNIQAVIRASAVNQDGFSSGFTVPNKTAQEALLSLALSKSSVQPADIDYIEAHGTGTALGDPIEVRALASVFGEKRERPLLIGSLKTNIGHLESAAGVAGLLKVVLCLQHKQIPPHLHFNQPNPHIDWSDIPVSVVTKLTDWTSNGKPRIAGVSSFGASGTNAHMIVSEAPSQQPKPSVTERPLHILTLSAQTQPSLLELASKYQQYLNTNLSLSVSDICFTSNTGRRHFNYRIAFLADSVTQLKNDLNKFINNEVASTQTSKSPKIAFLFSGTGLDDVVWARQLYQAQPSFARTIDKCNEILQSYLEQPLLSVLYPEARSPILDEVTYNQTALFAVGYALAKLWQSWGVEPTAVMGYSLGEYVAACVAGILSLEDALKLVAERGRLIQTLPNGEMLTVLADEAKVAAIIQPYSQDVSIAALNGSSNTVISGQRQALEEIKAVLKAQNIETKQLKVSHAFHSPMMEPILPAFEQIAKEVLFQAPCIPMISTLTGKMIFPNDTLDAQYWLQHCRQTVRFAEGMNNLVHQGYKIFLEISPKPVLSSLSELSHQKVNAIWLPSLVQKPNYWQVLLESLSTLYMQGANINWTEFDKDYSRNKLSLPTYPFQRKRYWFEKVNYPVNNTNGNKTDEKRVEIPNTLATKKSQINVIISALTAIIGNSLRVTPSEVNIRAPFLEMGADSILLIEITQSIENKYKIKIAISQILGELTNIERLASYIDQHLDPAQDCADFSQSEPKILQSIEATKSLNAKIIGEKATESSLKSIIEQQLQIMSRQLEILNSNSRTTANVKSQNIQSQTVKIASTPPANRNTSFPALDLNSKQQHHLEKLVERYTKRTQKSKQQAQNSRHVLADSRAIAGFRFSIKEMLYPIVGERANGSRFWDIDGNEYIDISMGFGVLLFGHAASFITEAIEQQIQLGIQIGPQSNLAGEVSQLVRELTGMERVTFCNSGTEGVMTALRLARTTTGRTKIAIFANSYHGHFDGVMAKASVIETSAVPMVPGISQQMIEDAIVLEYNNPQSLETLQACASELAAVLVEPIQSRHPELQPKEFLRKLRQLTEAAGIALIFDEVLTGFRIHPGGVQAFLGIKADIVVYGKIIGGGMPIGVIAGKAAYMDGIDGGLWNYGDASYPEAQRTFFAGTFNKNHIGMAAAKAVLQYLQKQGSSLQEKLNQRTSRFAETLNNYFKTENLPINIVHFGSLFRFSFAGNLDLLFYHLLEKGIYIWEGRNCFLSTAHTDADIDCVIQAVKNSVEELREGDFLPQRALLEHHKAI